MSLKQSFLLKGTCSQTFCILVLMMLGEQWMVIDKIK